MTATIFAARAAWLPRLCTILGASLVLAACGTKPEQSADLPPLVSVVTPGLSEVTDIVSFTGTINARDEMPITVEGEGGRISAVLVEIGDQVKKGQVLARLSTSVIEPQVNSLRAALEEARTSAELAAADYRRAQGVAASGALSKQEIERRRGAAANAEARVKVAAAQLAEVQARRGRTEIRAPMDGVVLTRTAEVGQTATVGGEPLFRLGRGGEIEMRGRVAEQDMAALAVGQPTKVYVTGVDEPFIGTVRLLGAVIDPDTRLGSIRIALPSDRNLRPGAFARGEVVVGTGKHPILPQTAVLSDTNGTYVMRLNADNRVSKLPVKVAGTRSNGVVIESGLQGDERIVSTAGAFLQPGETVRVAEPAQTTVAESTQAKGESR
ncbi:MAG TPA: efflux RND transporter periplasmic adaptor subunit [Steroidobacteraceae bacterium]|nr:efflux RND transporter periplasmic adaptor subunit [Steroidobacteraceae bacterium]